MTRMTDAFLPLLERLGREHRVPLLHVAQAVDDLRLGEDALEVVGVQIGLIGAVGVLGDVGLQGIVGGGEPRGGEKA